MGKKSGNPKSRWNKIRGCGCYYCMGCEVDEYLNNKYQTKQFKELRAQRNVTEIAEYISDKLILNIKSQFEKIEKL